jgi:hypothetical protein
MSETINLECFSLSCTFVAKSQEELEKHEQEHKEELEKLRRDDQDDEEPKEDDCA